MSAYLKRGIAVWISGFLTCIAFLNAFNAVLLWTLHGSDLEIEPYLIGQFTGRIQVMLYFWASVTTAFVLLGCTAVMSFRKPPLDPDLFEMLVMMNRHLAANKELLEEGLETNKKSMKTVETHLLERMKSQKRANEESFLALGADLENTRKETLDALEKQEKGLQKVNRELSSTIETSISDVKGEISGALAKQEEVVRRVDRSHKKSVRTIEKATADLADMKTRLETLENVLAPPQPRMTSHSNTMDVKGIGPRLAGELEAMGITNAGEFLIANPVAIDEKTRLTRETAERLQGTVQLLMVPSIDETDVELLEKVGVTNRKELAEQDPFELHRNLSEVAKTYVEERKISESEKPTVEEVLSWVKLAKF